MICTSIAEPDVEKCLLVLEGLDFAEIRLDRMPTVKNELERIFSRPAKLIATCRPGTMEENERKSLLMAAIKAGAAYVDIENDAGEGYREEIVQQARFSDCRVIISYHNYNKTPGRMELKRIVRSCFDSGADMVKIACRIQSEKDNSRLLGLLDDDRPLIVTGMGDKGKICRIMAPLLGSLFTYAPPATGKGTAPGQINRSVLMELWQRIRSV